MTKQKLSHQQQIQHEEDYVAFLKKRLESKHFRNTALPEIIEATERKYDKAKLALRLLKGKF